MCVFYQNDTEGKATWKLKKITDEFVIVNSKLELLAVETYDVFKKRLNVLAGAPNMEVVKMFLQNITKSLDNVTKVVNELFTEGTQEHVKKIKDNINSLNKNNDMTELSKVLSGIEQQLAKDVSIVTATDSIASLKQMYAILEVYVSQVSNRRSRGSKPEDQKAGLKLLSKELSVFDEQLIKVSALNKKFENLSEEEKNRVNRVELSSLDEKFENLIVEKEARVKSAESEFNVPPSKKPVNIPPPVTLTTEQQILKDFEDFPWDDYYEEPIEPVVDDDITRKTRAYLEYQKNMEKMELPIDYIEDIERTEVERGDPMVVGGFNDAEPQIHRGGLGRVLNIMATFFKNRL
jgi:hypothetical protein